MSSQRDRSLSQQLSNACSAGAQAGASYIRSRAGDLATIDWQEKTRADFVSEVDLGAEGRITDALLTAFPDALIIGEELTPRVTPGDGIAFVVDPLDGTTNFLHGYPQYSVSIAALVGSVTMAAIVLDVPRDAAFTATLGGGTRLNGTPIRVSDLTEPTRALIGTGFPFKDLDRLPSYLPQFARVVSQVSGIRRAGSAALDLADVAAGRFEGFWELMLAPWDMAAGTLLVREAGGRVSDLEGQDVGIAHTPVVASNGLMHDWLLAQLRSDQPLPTIRS